MVIDREQLKLVAIFRGLTETEALQTADVFIDAGVRAIEVTCNTDNASQIIASLKLRYQHDLLVGAGTVLSCDQVESARRAGASFILSPDCYEPVIKATKEAGLLSIPGAFTATEIMQAVRFGADMVKLFPAGRLGTAYVKDLLGPLDHVQFMAVGAIDLHNLADFFQAGVRAVGVGSSLVDRNLIRAGKFSELKQLAMKYVETIQGISI